MKKTIAIVLNFFFVFISYGQETKQNVYEVCYLKVKTGSENKFESAVLKHIKSFYNIESKAHLRKINQGYRSGEYLLIKGPMKISFLDQKNKIRDDDWNENILSLAYLNGSNIYRNHPEYSSMSKSESGNGKVVFVRGFRQQNWKTTFHILKRLKDMSDMSEGCNPYNIVTPIAKSEDEPDFYIVRHLSSMGEFDEDDLFDNKNCNIGEVFQKEMSKEERENLPQMWGDNFEIVFSHFRTLVD